MSDVCLSFFFQFNPCDQYADLIPGYLSSNCSPRYNNTLLYVVRLKWNCAKHSLRVHIQLRMTNNSDVITARVTCSSNSFYRAMLCIARTMPSQYVCLPVRPSVCHTPVFCRNGYTCSGTYGSMRKKTQNRHNAVQRVRQKLNVYKTAVIAIISSSINGNWQRHAVRNYDN